jgi:phosphopantetheinyl transferase (holo-ACP synthase)
MAERVAVKRLLRMAFPDIPDIRIGHYPSGAPFLTFPAPNGETPDEPIGEPWPTISVTHCKEMAAIALAPANARIGIDCETPDRENQLSRVSTRFLAPKQMKSWGNFPASLWAWTIKEAAYKAVLQPGLEFSKIPLPMEIPVGQTSPDAVIAIKNEDYNVVQIDTADLQAILMLVFADFDEEDDDDLDSYGC